MNQYTVLMVYSLFFVIQWCTMLKALFSGQVLKDSNNAILQEVARFQVFYFTVWTYILQMVFVGVAMTHELGKLSHATKAILKQLEWLRAFLFSTFAFPCGLAVFTLFWFLWNIDRELVFPAVIDTVLPPWVNYSLHGFILLPCTFEFFLPKSQYVFKFWTTAKIILTFAVFYQIIYHSIYFLHGVWLYQIYNVLNWPQRMIFSVTQLFLAVFFVKIALVLRTGKKIDTMKVK